MSDEQRARIQRMAALAQPAATPTAGHSPTPDRQAQAKVTWSCAAAR